MGFQCPTLCHVVMSSTSRQFLLSLFRWSWRRFLPLFLSPVLGFRPPPPVLNETVDFSLHVRRSLQLSVQAVARSFVDLGDGVFALGNVVVCDLGCVASGSSCVFVTAFATHGRFQAYGYAGLVSLCMV